MSLATVESTTVDVLADEVRRLREALANIRDVAGILAMSAKTASGHNGLATIGALAQEALEAA